MPKHLARENTDRPGRRKARPHRPRQPHMQPEADPVLKTTFARIGRPDPRPFQPDPFQLQALASIREGDCIVTAPTGAGKTWIAEEAIRIVTGGGGRCWYASPLKALSNAKWTEFGQIFGADRVGILTGDLKDNPDAPIIVGTTEILRNQLYDAMHRGEDLNCELVILDEAHYLGDRDRGV
ncbi:MAG TPA: DEAD/DEAH box helicase, partial [Syntrophales bacterium]|nr:DEAD/DEAH box helicase [Syntrophales bacterium]